MKRKRIPQGIAIFILLAMLAAMAGGCVNSPSATVGSPEASPSQTAAQTSTPEPSASAAVEEPSEPVPIRWVRTANEQDPTKDRILLELQKRLNIELEIISMPWDQFPNKLNIMMASGEYIDIANCDANMTLIEWARNGIVQPYDDYLKDGKYPYISSIVNSEIYSGLKIDGKIYYKPLALCPKQGGWIIRQDWLDKLGLSIPTTLDEYYEVIKAFSKNDPDGNGKNDTYGIYVRAGAMTDPPRSFDHIARAFAVNAAIGSWVELPDGTVTRFEASDAAKESAAFVRKIVSEGLINKDWLTLKGDATQGPESDDFAIGKYGIAQTTIPDLFIEKLAAANPEGKVSYLPPFGGSEGVQINGGCSSGYWWGNIIPATSKNPEKALELLEYAMTEEGRELTSFGIEGIHFTSVKEDETARVYTINKEECDKDWDTAKNGYLYPLTWGGLNYFEYAYIPIKEKNFNYDEAYKNYIPWLPEEKAQGQFPNWPAMNSKYAVPSPLMNVLDEKMLGDQSKLLSIYVEGYLQAVLASEAEFGKAWDGMISNWMEAGGESIIAYGNEYYKSNK